MGALNENLARLRARLRDAEKAAARAPGAVQLLPVTKSVDIPLTLELTRAGELDLAENRVAPLEQKARAANARGIPVRWHFIGHLQRNKARRVVRIAQVIHSVDSLRLIETLERIASEEDRQLEIYLEVQLSGEAEKSGLLPDQMPAALSLLARAGTLNLKGIMVMGPRNSLDTKKVFAQAQALAQQWQADHPVAFCSGQCQLSMGMSDDLELAVQAGSHVVRVGSALFEGIHPQDTSEGAA